MSKPVKSYSLGSVQVSEFRNAGKDGKEFSSFCIQKNYKKQDGTWGYSQSFTSHDLANIASVCNLLAGMNARVFTPKDSYPGQNAPGQDLSGGEWNPEEYQDKF